MSSTEPPKKPTNKGRPRKYASEQEARESSRANQRRKYHENKQRIAKQIEIGKSCYELLRKIETGSIDQDELIKEFRDLRVNAFDQWAPAVFSS